MLGETAVYLKERTIIPHGQLHAETMPPAPDGDVVAVEELPPGNVPANPLAVTGKHITDHEVLPLGFDHAKLQVYFDELMARMAGNDITLEGGAALPGGDHSFAVSRLMEHGTRSRDVMYNILSYAMLTGQVDKLLSDEGLRMPMLVREGGPATDNYGWVTVRLKFVDPEMMGWFHGWVEAVNYDFDERQQFEGRESEIELDLDGGGALNTGNLSETLSPVSPARRTVTGLANVSLGHGSEKTSGATIQVMKRYDAVNRPVPRLRVSVGAQFTIEMEAENKRDGFSVPVPGLEGGKVTFTHLIRHAAELGLSPEAAVEFGLHHPGGIPVPSGTWFPGPAALRGGTESDRLLAAHLVPFLNRAFAVQVDLVDGHFMIGENRVTVGQLAEGIRQRLSELGPEPPPGLSAEEMPPPAPRRLESPDDPVFLISPRAGVIPPGGVTEPAQELADALGRPVVTPESGYLITRDGSVLAVDAPPGATSFGQGWQPWTLDRLLPPPHAAVHARHDPGRPGRRHRA